MLKCPRCDRTGEHQLHKNWGRLYYCARHFRLIWMRYKARATGKMVPDLSTLEDFVDALNNFKCPCCLCVMVWFARQDTRRVITLQHNNDGTMMLICMSCNSKHAQHSLGDACLSLPSGVRYCKMCNTIKPLGDFYNSYLAYCKRCTIERQRAYRLNSKQVVAI